MGIFQPMFMAIFTWGLVTICGAMLLFQVELVEYFLIFCTDSRGYSRQKIYLTLFFAQFSVTRWTQLSGITCNNFLCNLFVWPGFYRLWAWPTNDHCLRGNWWSSWTIQVVLVSCWSTAYLTDNYKCGTATGWCRMLREYHVQPILIQKRMFWQYLISEVELFAR